jgi:hypothetical protein
VKKIIQNLSNCTPYIDPSRKQVENMQKLFQVAIFAFYANEDFLWESAK